MQKEMQATHVKATGVKVTRKPVKTLRVKVTPNVISRNEVQYLDLRHPTQHARGYASGAGLRDASGANIMVHYNDCLPSGTSSSSRIDDPQNEFLAEQVNTVMTKVVHKLEAVLQSQNVMQPPRETVMEEFHRGKMTRSGTEFGGAQIVKKEKTTPAPVFDPNDTSEGIPQPPTAAGPLPVRASRVKRVATITTGYIQD